MTHSRLLGLVALGLLATAAAGPCAAGEAAASGIEGVPGRRGDPSHSAPGPATGLDGSPTAALARDGPPDRARHPRASETVPGAGDWATVALGTVGSFGRRTALRGTLSGVLGSPGLGDYGLALGLSLDF
jgi:hypothetical protein